MILNKNGILSVHSTRLCIHRYVSFFMILFFHILFHLSSRKNLSFKTEGKKIRFYSLLCCVRCFCSVFSFTFSIGFHPLSHYRSIHPPSSINMTYAKSIYIKHSMTVIITSDSESSRGVDVTMDDIT